MKLNIINKVLGVGMAALLLTACTDANDWTVDSSKARLFSVSASDIKVDRDMTFVDVDFKTVKGAESYTLEISTDELNDNIEEGGTPNSRIFHFASSEAVESKIATTIHDLKKDTRYYLRVRSDAEGQKSSKWTYYKDSKNRPYFKTKAEQLFSTYTYFAQKIISPKYLKEDEVELHWKNDEGSEVAAVTNLIIQKDGEEVANIPLSDEDIAARQYTVKYADYGFGPETTFTVFLYNNDDKRGQLAITTPKERPAGLHILDEAGGETIKGLIEGGSGDIIIGIPGSASDDATTDMITVNGFTIPSTVTSVTLYGLAGGIPRLLDFTKEIRCTGDLTKIRFENIQVQTSAKFGGLLYLKDISNAITVGAIEFEDVTIPQLYQSSLVQLANTPGATVNKLYMNHVDFKKQTDSSTRFIYANANDNVFEDIEINNSTFAVIQNAMFDNNGKGIFKKIVLSDVTLYNCIGKGKYFVSAKNADPAPIVQAYRTIFAKSNGANCRGIQSILNSYEPKSDRDAVIKAAYTFSSSYMTSDFVLETTTDPETGEVKPNFPFYVGTSVSSSTKIMKDPKNGIYTIIDATVEGGDPRWIEPDDD